MAVGIDQDTESLQRGSIPSGGAGTLSDGAFANTAQLVWVYRPSSGNSYGLTAEGSIIHLQAGAREVKLGFDNTFGAGTSADPLLQVIFNSGGGTGATQTFSGANLLDEWVAYAYYESGGTQNVGYIRQSAPNTFVKISRANDNAGSQYVNTLTFGNHGGNSTAVLGHYAYPRARYASGLTDADIIAWAASTSPLTGDWGFWDLTDNTDTADSSGNGRSLTFNGTLTSESDPTLAGPPPTFTVQPKARTINDGGTAILTATATGADTLQWRDNRSGSFASVIDGSGGTTDTYTTAALGLAASGRQYRLRATNAGGFTDSDPVAITVSTIGAGRLGHFDPELRIEGWF